MKHTILAIIALLFFTAPTLFGATLGVPVPYATLADAIVAAAPFDTIVVAPGTYSGTGFEWLTVEKPLSITSSGGPDSTIVLMAPYTDFVYVSCHKPYNEDSTRVFLDGLTVRGAYCGVYAAIVPLHLSRCRFVACTYAVVLDSTWYTMGTTDSCVFDSCYGGYSVLTSEYYVELTHSLFRGNWCGLYAQYSADLDVTANTFVLNKVGLLFHSTSNPYVRENVFFGDSVAVATDEGLLNFRNNDVCARYDNYSGEDLTGMAGNFSADPRFCDPTLANLSISSLSPLLAQHDPTGHDIGFFTGIGCYCGDVDANGSGPDIGDLTRLIDFLFISNTPITPPDAGFIDNTPGTDIGDLTYLISYLFLSGPPPGC